MKIRLHPRNLLLYCAVAAASIAFSSFYGGPASYTWLYAVLLLIPLSAAYIGANYHFLRIFQEIEVHRLVRGEDHFYRAKIENSSPLPIHNMGIRLHADRCTLYEMENGQKLSLEPHGIKELTSGISCKYAGSYDIGIRNVDFTDPFGLFTVILDVPYTFRAVVSPPVTNLADTVLDLENLFNSSYLKSSRLTEDTPGSDMRPYQTGDPLKAINWKVSARLGEMVTRIPDKMEKRTVTILMQAAYDPDRKPDPAFLQKRDYFLEFAVSASWHFAGQGVPVRLLYPAGRIVDRTIDSYETFMDFYNTVADGIFYYSKQEFEQFRALSEDLRKSAYDNATGILIREDPEPGQNNFTIVE